MSVTLADVRSLVVTLRDQHRERAKAQRAKCEHDHPDYHASLVSTREAFGAIHGLASVDLGMVLSAIDSLEKPGGAS
jgi:hypothetical protein